MRELTGSATRRGSVQNSSSLGPFSWQWREKTRYVGGRLARRLVDGPLAAWMHRDASFDVQQINTIATEAANVANQQGWLPA